MADRVKAFLEPLRRLAREPSLYDAADAVERQIDDFVRQQERSHIRSSLEELAKSVEREAFSDSSHEPFWEIVKGAIAQKLLQYPE